MSAEQDALSQVKAVYDDGFAEINGREYHFTKMRHKQRRSVFAFLTSVQESIQRGDFSFFDYPQFSNIEKIIADSVTFDGSLLSRCTDHWEGYPEDYVIFTVTALGVISYPFLGAGATASQSQSAQEAKSTLKKPI